MYEKNDHNFFITISSTINLLMNNYNMPIISKLTMQYINLWQYSYTSSCKINKYWIKFNVSYSQTYMQKIYKNKASLSKYGREKSDISNKNTKNLNHILA